MNGAIFTFASPFINVTSSITAISDDSLDVVALTTIIVYSLAVDASEAFSIVIVVTVV